MNKWEVDEHKQRSERREVNAFVCIISLGLRAGKRANKTEKRHEFNTRCVYETLMV